LHVLARDVKTGREKIVEVKSTVNVDDAAVQQMVEESVAHAFEDLAARRWVEAKLRANETLAATRKALADGAGEIAAGDRAKIEAVAREVDTALATEKSEAGTGDLRQLQAAMAALDEITRPLAESLMDKAMEAMLRKRGVIQ
jgi:molecular chaperone DnaK